MKKIKLLYAIPAVILLSAGAFFLYAQNLKSDLLQVYNVDPQYTQSPQGADITVLEFHKFDCDVSQKVHPLLNQAMARDGKVRYIPRPVSFEQGDLWAETLSRAVYAAALQGKFIQMHNALYKAWPIETRESLLNLATQIGLDTAKLEQDMDSADVTRRIEENKAAFKAWNFRRTPVFLIDKKILFAPNEQTMPSVEDFLEKFERMRKEK